MILRRKCANQDSGMHLSSFQVHFGTTEEVPEIDKICIQPTVRVFREESLSVIDMLSTDINEPCQPKARGVDHSPEAGPWQDFKESIKACPSQPRSGYDSGFKCFSPYLIVG
jgi:hypothetical protein